MSEARPTILVLTPMPAFPASAGNRKRLLATCEVLQRGGFAVDLAYWAHEDQIYRRFGQHPPTDCEAMRAAFQRIFLIEPHGRIRLTTRATHFSIDAWCPDEVGKFVAWYFARHPQTRAILVNYVFLARALEQAPAGVLKLIDTHDRFAGRRNQYRLFKAEPNFFYTDEAGEAAGLDRADIVLAIQSAEARHFAKLTTRTVQVLPPHFSPRREFRTPERIARIGFLGHGNDPNVFSLDAFARTWSEDWTGARPELVIAGEICRTGAAATRPGLRPLGFVEDVEEFYDGVDLVVAPMLMGTGLKMKVAEALSFGLPVVGTAIGFEGFDTLDPAHRCQNAQEVKARVLALTGDRAALAALTEASADLFARYNQAAYEAERAFIAMLRERIAPLEESHRPSEHASFEEEPLRGSTARVGCALTIQDEHSARSLPAAVDQYGTLVATERVPSDGSEAGYSPLRRRWYARASMPTGELPRFTLPVGLRMALSPEWLHGRALGEARPLLASAFSGAAADWEASGRVVDATEERIEIVLDLPSFLARGRHPSAAFLIAADGKAAELRLEGVTPLQVARPNCQRPTLASLDEVPLVPAAASFLTEGAAVPEGTLLLLTDDLIGRVRLAGKALS